MMQPPETIMEERRELMVSPNDDATPTLRTAHFLKPSVTSIDDPFLKPPSHSLASLPPTFEPKKWPLMVNFNGWRHPGEKWKTWVNRLYSTHQPTWKKAGIYEAIMGSTCLIQRNNDLVFGVAERWCSETNTFVFSWGEATVTLEDMMILGGFSVLGDSVLSPLESQELKKIEEKLLEARILITRTKVKKASQQVWMRQFMENESEFEHEAMLSFWLSRFVFPNARDSVRKQVFPIAICLARGTRMALAPAVLASIYKDLSLLKAAIVASTKLDIGDINGDDGVLDLTLWSPLHLVQAWLWERFVSLRPTPNLIEFGEPRLAQWHELNGLEHANVRLAFDSAGEFFQWRPYALILNDNCLFCKFYGEIEQWVSVGPDMDGDLESFARCLRVCELVGIDCVEQYLPHRVAMQFGMDQDLPGHAARCNESPEIAWRSYVKPITDAKLYIPSRHFEADVTARYFEWWRQSASDWQDSTKSNMQHQKIPKSLKTLMQSSKEKKGGNDASVPPGFPPKCNWVETGGSAKEDKLTLAEFFAIKRSPHSSKKAKGKGHSSVSSGFHRRCNRMEVGSSSEEDGLTPKEMSSSKRLQLSSKDKEGNGSSCVPATFPPNCNRVETSDSAEEDELTIGEMLRLHKNNNNVSAMEENPDGSKARSRVNNMRSIDNNEGESSSYNPCKIPGLELEARIIKLERVVTKLREKYECRFVVNPMRGGTSDP